MQKKQSTSRRNWLKTAGLAAAGTLTLAGSLRAENDQEKGKEQAQEKPKKKLSFKNEQFYDAEGKFDVEKGKDAILELCKYHGYPIFPGMRENLWVSDYGLGHFTQLGLSAYKFMNEKEGGYLQLELFLLPNQMLPEHYHVKTDLAEPKMEGWLCRYGQSYVYGEGPKTENMYAKIPEFEKTHVTTFHETIIDPGQSAHLTRPTSRHWQFAGPEGVILTEVGTFHDDAAVRHTDPNIVFP